MHGRIPFRLNTDDLDKNYFNLINPCGITDYDICNMSDVIDNPNIEDVKTRLIQEFERLLKVTFEYKSLQDFEQLYNT